MAIKRFSDFSDEPIRLDGEKIQLDRVLNQEIIITGYRILTSKYPGKNKSGDALQLQFRLGAEPDNNLFKTLFTGSDVLIAQIKKYADQIPFYASIVKINRYYTFQ